MLTGENITIDDCELINKKFKQRQQQHEPSAKYKARGKIKEKKVCVAVGDIIYLYCDRDKTKGRDRYIVMDVKGEHCTVQKLLERQFRGKRYKVHNTEIIKVQHDENFTSTPSDSDSDSLAVDRSKADDDVDSSHDESQDSDNSDTIKSLSEDDDYTDSNEQLSDEAQQPTAEPTGNRPKRTKKLPSRFKNFIMGSP
jgi:hypothetical protein